MSEMTGEISYTTLEAIIFGIAMLFLCVVHFLTILPHIGSVRHKEQAFVQTYWPDLGVIIVGAVMGYSMVMTPNSTIAHHSGGVTLLWFLMWGYVKCILRH